MSMLTAQCDELRVMASELREIQGHNTDWLRDEAVTLASAADAMAEAADTILSLRDRLQEAGNVDAERDAIFSKAIRRIVEKNTDFSIVDIGESHRQADELLCNLLLSHGYIETVDEFKSMRKWYA